MINLSVNKLAPACGAFLVPPSPTPTPRARVLRAPLAHYAPDCNPITDFVFSNYNCTSIFLRV